MFFATCSNSERDELPIDVFVYTPTHPRRQVIESRNLLVVGDFAIVFYKSSFSPKSQTNVTYYSAQ